MNIRKAVLSDLDAVERIYDKIHRAEEQGLQTIGWIRGIYPVRDTALKAYERNDLFVLEDKGRICGTAIINQTQVDSYQLGDWKYKVSKEQVCVLHTLVIDPECAGHGYGRAFIHFFETYALEQGCIELRIDTNVKNKAARRMYHKYGYDEIGIVPTDFNGIPDIQLVLLEKNLKK